MIYCSNKKHKTAPPVNMGMEEFFQIARRLEEYNSVFSELWRMGTPIMTDNYGGKPVLTAEVHFDDENRAIKIYINPHLWARLDEDQRLFILCHECLHVVFNYGFRVMALDDKYNANVAADVAINQILARDFMFYREDIDPHDELCWQNNGFLKTLPDVEKMQTLEYYYNKLSNEIGKKSGGKGEKMDGSLGDEEGRGQGEPGDGMQFFLGNHENLSKEDCEATEEICKKLNETLSQEEKEALREMIEQHFVENEDDTKPHSPGTSAGGVWVFIEKKPVKHKKKWETIIKKWANTQIRPDRRDIEQWTMINRRFVLLPRDLIIPSEMEMDAMNEEKKKIEVWFFQDTSGSCSGYRNRFFAAAESLPPKRFDIKMHCFDTQVYETTLESRKLYGFGGTSFHPIENYILANSKGKGGYPKAVFIITDGYGTNVRPKHPEKWYVFLTPGGSRGNFPKECNFFELKNFE